MGNSVSCFDLRDAGCRNSRNQIREEASPAAFAGEKVNSSGPTLMSYDELELATNHFDRANVLERGKFTHVYKGTLKTGEVVAVKRFGIGLEGFLVDEEYRSKMALLSSLEHPHLTKQLGFCFGDEYHRLVVFEFMFKGSLEDLLFDRKQGQPILDWNTRMKIALGVAQGLEYLHKHESLLVHGDLKASDIFLDENYNPKLFDFGMAKTSYGHHRMSITRGYFPPECIYDGLRTTMFDIYSLGIVLFELISGRRTLHKTRSGKEIPIAFWAPPLVKNPTKHIKLADPLLQDQYPKDALRGVGELALECINHDPQKRPVIEHVVAVLLYWAEQPYDPDNPNLGYKDFEVRTGVHNEKTIIFAFSKAEKVDVEAERDGCCIKRYMIALTARMEACTRSCFSCVFVPERQWKLT